MWPHFHTPSICQQIHLDSFLISSWTPGSDLKYFTWLVFEGEGKTTNKPKVMGLYKMTNIYWTFQNAPNTFKGLWENIKLKTVCALNNLWNQPPLVHKSQFAPSVYEFEPFGYHCLYKQRENSDQTLPTSQWFFLVGQLKKIPPTHHILSSLLVQYVICLSVIQ